MVLTAGHCVVEARSWGRDLVFIPAFDHGRRPFGTFAAEAVFTTPEWRQSENTDFDVAALLVKPNRLGTLSSVVGSRGYETDRSRYSAFQIFGYPAGALGGEELRSCLTHGLGSDPLTEGLNGPPTVPSKCNMAAGSSGGAWITEGQYIDGVTSYGYAHHFNRLYSPVFRRSHRRLPEPPSLSWPGQSPPVSPRSAGPKELTMAPPALARWERPKRSSVERSSEYGSYGVESVESRVR